MRGLEREISALRLMSLVRSSLPVGLVRETCLIWSDTGARGVMGFIFVGVVGWRNGMEMVGV